jgi:hypothetical protein
MQLFMKALLEEHRVAGILNVAVKTLQAWRGRGGGPRFVRLGRAVRYRPEDVEAFIAAGTRCSTSDSGRSEGGEL